MNRTILLAISIVLIIAGTGNVIARLFIDNGILCKFANSEDIGYDLVLGYVMVAIGVSINNNI